MRAKTRTKMYAKMRGGTLSEVGPFFYNVKHVFYGAVAPVANMG